MGICEAFFGVNAESFVAGVDFYYKILLDETYVSMECLENEHV